VLAAIPTASLTECPEEKFKEKQKEAYGKILKTVQKGYGLKNPIINKASNQTIKNKNGK